MTGPPDLTDPDTPATEATFDPAEDAQRELAEGMVMPPDDLLGDVGPLAQLLYLSRTGWHVLQQWTAMLASEAGDVVDDDSGPVRALAAITQAVGMLDYAQSTVGLIPPEQVAPTGQGETTEART